LIKKLIERNDLLPHQIDEVVLANAFGTGGNMARYASLSANLPDSVSSFTIDSQCSGGLKSVDLAYSMIKSDAASLVIAGGMESKSLAAKKAYQAHDERFDANNEFYTTAKFSPEQSAEFPLLTAAQNVAVKYDVSKEEMLAWAKDSHRKAFFARENQVLNPFVEKIANSHQDQSIRNGVDLIQLATNDLIDRTISAHYNDGAACVLIGHDQSSLRPIAKIIATASAGVAPDFAPEGVIFATQKLLEKIKFSISQIDLFEINESFALIPLIFAKVFGLDHHQMNTLGGTLAYGHPFGASGAINLIHLIAALQHKNLKYGLVVIPAAGGQATAMLVEKL
jgi:acetyl-CoA C-acetyltransferase